MRRGRLRFAAELAVIVLLAAFAAANAEAFVQKTLRHPANHAPCGRITAATPLYLVERHFGRPRAQSVGSGGVGTFLYAGRRHNWTIVLQIRPIPRGHS